MPTIKLNLKRRWTQARPGSVLILVIALLVLLALLGTAYLSSTQTERYSAQQNSVNTEADLLVQGLIDATNSAVAGSLFGTTSSGLTYRPPGQEMPTYNGTTPVLPPAATGYHSYDSVTTDAFLASRHPQAVLLSGSTNPFVPYWPAVTWPLFADGSGNLSFDSPFDGSASLYLASNKNQVISYPTYRSINGQLYPAMLYYIPPTQVVQGSGTPQTTGTGVILIPVQSSDNIPVTGVTLQTPAGPMYVQYSTNGVFLTPLGLELSPTNNITSTSFYGLPAVNSTAYGNWANFAASASGDGIADGGMTKLPIGQINNITYYYSLRVIDNNSAVNVSSAWTSSTDPPITQVNEPFTPSPKNVNANYGFYRSAIGLREMLNPNPLTLTSEMNNLNEIRFGMTQLSTAVPPFMTATPMQDQVSAGVSSGSIRTDFVWESAGDAMEHQLIARPGNPGFNTLQQKFSWLGPSQTAALAYKFTLADPNASASLVEQSLQSETEYGYNPYVRSNEYSPAQANTVWYPNNFNFPPSIINATANTVFNYTTSSVPPLRTVLTGNSAVSNATSSRLGNASATTPVVYNSSTTYNFGDWVTTTQGYSYVCILANPTSANPPPLAVNGVITDSHYWAAVPWTTQPVKASINTATFNQLWLGFCQTMTDSILAPGVGNNTVPQWQPPMLPEGQTSNYLENQMQQFRSSIRDNRSNPIANTTNTGNPSANPTRLQLTPMQEMQLRASLAAINVISMRNAQDPSTGASLAAGATRSHMITLADTNGQPAYDVEVFGTGGQPYIGQMFVSLPPLGQAINATNAFIAIQLLNPYPFPINVGSGWGFSFIDRTKYTNGTVSAPLTLAPKFIFTNFTILRATASGPGVTVLYEGTPPTLQSGTGPMFTIPTDGTGVRMTNLTSAIGKEFIILKPRLLDQSTGKDSSVLSAESDNADQFNEGTSPVSPNLVDLVPVDQLDMTGLDQMQAAAITNYVYKRGSDPNVPSSASASNSNTFAWNFVWPGFYTPYNLSTYGLQPPSTAPQSQPAGTYPFCQAIVKLTGDPQFAYTFNNLTGSGLTGGLKDTSGIQPASPTYDTISLQINNWGFPGPNQVSPSGNRFPFGGFARNADLLQVPFIGAYRISAHQSFGSPSLPNFYEMNSVTMDSSLANDSTLQPAIANTPYFQKKVIPSTVAVTVGNVTINADQFTDPFVEQIGRFCPIGDSTPQSATNPAAQLDFGPGYASGLISQNKAYWHYHWARKVFDYFTVQAPHDDYFPNVDPAPPMGTNTSGGTAVYAKYTAGAVVPVNNTSIQTVSPSTTGYMANALIAKKSEDTAGVEGLININTAPWPVLATLPFVPPGTDNLSYYNPTNPAQNTLQPSVPATGTTPTALTATPNQYSDNIDLAMAIVDYRNQHGPFKSIMDLYNVPAFQLENQFLLKNDPTSVNGDFSGGPLSIPSTATNTAGNGDNVRFDFEEKFLLLNNISNLITTRSDTFTCYVLLQGWRNAGTGNPTLAVQRRAAFLVDRTGVTASNTKPTSTKMPSQ